MTLEDVLIGLQVVEHSGKGGVQFGSCSLIIINKAYRYIILLCLDIKQIVDGQLQIVTPHVGIVDGNGDIGLLVGGFIKQGFQLVAQVAVVAEADRADGYKHADDDSPVKELKKQTERDGE